MAKDTRAHSLSLEIEWTDEVQHDKNALRYSRTARKESIILRSRAVCDDHLLDQYPSWRFQFRSERVAGWQHVAFSKIKGTRHLGASHDILRRHGAHRCAMDRIDRPRSSDALESRVRNNAVARQGMAMARATREARLPKRRTTRHGETRLVVVRCHKSTSCRP